MRAICFVVIISAAPTAPPTGYLFLCPPMDLQTGPSSFRWPDYPAYWSLDPLGAEHLSMEDATQLGFPSIELITEVNGRCWDESVYTGLRQFHRAKGFDPDSQDVALHLGYPLYQLSNEMDIPFAHVDDEDSYSEESDQHSVSMDDESEETQSLVGEEPTSDAAPEPALSTGTAPTEIFSALDDLDSITTSIASSAVLATPVDWSNTFSTVPETDPGTPYFPNYWDPVDLNVLSTVAGTFAPTYPVYDSFTHAGWRPVTVDEPSTSFFMAPSIDTTTHNFSVGFGDLQGQLDWTMLPSPFEFLSPPHIHRPVNPLKRRMEVEEKSHESTMSKKRSRTAEWLNLVMQ